MPAAVGLFTLPCFPTEEYRVIVCGAALLIAAAVGVMASRDRRRELPLPEVPVAAPIASVRVKVVERKAERGDDAEVSGTVAIVCGADDATADRYEVRNDALRSIARRRSWLSERKGNMV